MQNKRPVEQGMEMGLDDIYFVLFRHKWKIIICALIGFGVAIGMYVSRPKLYQSEAELYIKYVNESTAPTPVEAANEVRTSGTDSIINSELEILKSLDLAQKVVADIGAEKILAKWGGGSDPAAAALVISKNFTVEASFRSVVVHLLLTHPDPALVQPILRDIIDTYMDKHREVHNSPGQFEEFLASQRDNYNATLTRVLQKLREARKEAGVISVDAARESIQAKKIKLSDELDMAQAAQEEEQGKINVLTSNNLAVATEAKSTNDPLAGIPPKKIDEYKAISKRLKNASDLIEDRLYQYTEANPLVKEAREQKDVVEKHKDALEAKFPGLTNVDVTATDAKPATGNDLLSEKMRLSAIDLRIKFLTNQLARIQVETQKIDDAEGNMMQLEKEKKMAEDELAVFSHNWEQSKIQEQLAAGKIPNIKRIQEPSTPTLERSKTDKLVAMAAAAGILLGLAWAFAVEFYLDRSVKRPKEIEGKLGLPLFLSIPDTRRKNALRGIPAGDHPLLLKDTNEEIPSESDEKKDVPAIAETALAVKKNGSLKGSPLDTTHTLQPFFEALRNRLLGYFEVNKVVHNPKLVAVTGCSISAGATTIAMGLAASLSETGDGNVLLVDMNLEHGSAQQFYRGKLQVNIDDALKRETRDNALVQENLYVASANGNGDKISRMLPKKFAKLVPQLKASDYDYIIFDMPPISRSGVTQRLTSFMDMTLLVVEAEKSSRDVVKQAGSLLKESNANISVVLNKTRSYIPARLHQEF